MENLTKRKLNAGETVVGSSIQQSRSPEIPRIYAAAQADFFWIDAEHGSYGRETVQDLVAAAIPCGITPLVRVAELHYSLVTGALDAGAHGVILPRVECPNQLVQAASWTRFPPDGIRGFGIGVAQNGYRAASMPQLIQERNEQTLLVVQFETRRALDAAHELLAVPGVHIAMVGPADLSISLGIPGEFDHPRMRHAVENLISQCQQFNVVPGIHVRSANLASAWRQRGMRFLSVGSESTLLLERATSLVTELRRAGSPAPH
jgi:2-dehydro-3-deoxyglucarate aldolase/4-hydroxy-2-oxoheptanedioate aldolase